MPENNQYSSEEYVKSKPLKVRTLSNKMIEAFSEVKHPGERISEVLWKSKLKQVNASQLAGIPNTAFNELIKGKRNITPEVAIKLEKLSGKAEDWLILQNNYDLYQLRKLKADKS